jgi:hypothetical protein
MSNRKVDRKALKDSNAMIIPRSDREVMAPRDGIEQSLVQIERLLSVQPIGIRSSFFDLGGYSLLVITLLRVRQQLESAEYARAESQTPHLSVSAGRIPGAAAFRQTAPSALRPRVPSTRGSKT